MNRPKQAESCRVLLLVENLSFPWDRRMRHIGKALQQAGYEVSVISPKGDKQDRSSFEMIDGIRVYRYAAWHASSGLGYLIEYPWAFFRTLLLTLWVGLRHGIDIIHSANPPDLFFLLAWPLKLFGVRYVFDEHDVSPELYEAKFRRRDLAYRLLLLLQRASYRTADLVIATNQSYRDIAIRRGRLPEERTAIVRNGVDLQYFHARAARADLKEGRPYMAMYLGVMGRQDGVDGLIHVANELVNVHRRRDVLFVFVGKGECLDELKHLAHQMQLEDFVRFTGRISDDLLMDYLSTADVCLAPDPPDDMNQLSTMIKILEYMACKRPIVSFDLVESRRSAAGAAVYVGGGDLKLFAKELHQLLNDPERRQKMGEAGYERTCELLGWHKSREALLSAYSRLSNGRVPLEQHAFVSPLASPSQPAAANDQQKVSVRAGSNP